jgi:polyisoprenoid-binding protein YceI
MQLEPGTHTLSPADGTLSVLTGRGGAAAKAGHDLTIEVTRWRGTIDVGETISLTLTADARSLRVREGSGGMKELDDDDKNGIARTIHEEVLKGTRIEFRSSNVALGGSRLEVTGELELMGVRRPLELALNVDDGRLTGSAMVKQSDWRMKPFSALFGTLKVADVVEVRIDARVPAHAAAARSEQHG